MRQSRRRAVSIVSIPVSDQAAAKQFYTRVLGVEVVRDDPMGAERRWVQLRPEGAETSVVLVTWFAEMAPGMVRGLVLETPDIDADVQLFRKRGLELKAPRDAPWARFTTFEDPDANGWVLQQTLPEGS